MTIEGYLEELLQSQSNIPDKYLKRINNLKEGIRDLIDNLDRISQKPIPYDAGSKKKHTMIKECFDFDMLFYFPSDTEESIEDIYNFIFKALKSNYDYVTKNNAAIRIQFPNEIDLEKHHFHVDVVPAKRITGSKDEAFLYQSKTGTKLKTSLEKHLESVRDFERYDILKLLKLWKFRKSVDFPSFTIEQIAIEATKGIEQKTMKRAELLIHIFKYICKKLSQRKKIEDPANPSHNILDGGFIEIYAKEELIRESCIALDQNLDTIQGWKNIFYNSPRSTEFAGIRQREGKIRPNAPNAGRFGRVI